MRALRFQFQPAQIEISAEEILADLRYPAPAARPPAGRAKPRARRKTRS
jgi:hypothetical protein